MAVYKVPQDVEADDKLIGPFSFRQFIYLIITAIAGAMAWGLFQLFPLLVIIPLPIIVFFGALALPLRKDQPMEIYLAARVSFLFKPNKRLWNPDGIESLIEITVPKVIEVQRTKNISQGEAQERFGYLAQIVDSQGWAVRGQANAQAPNSAMTSDAYFEAQQAEDILDSSNNVAQSLDYMIGKSDEKRHQDMIDRIRQTASAPVDPVTTPTTQTVPAPYNFFPAPPLIGTPPPPVAQPTPYAPPADAPVVVASYATSPVTGPVASQPQPTPMVVAAPQPVTTSEKVVPAGIMELANNADLSIETIAHEANRIAQQSNMGEEVVISLR